MPDKIKEDLCMKKRLLCLALCVLMIAGACIFTGCSSSAEDDTADNIAKENSRSTKTLNMYLMTEDKTDPEAAAAVEEAINKITKSKFKTKINITFLTESEYYSKLEATFTAKAEEAEQAEAAAKALKKYVKEHKAEYGNEGAKEKFYEEYPEYLKYAETTTDPTAETTPEETVYNKDTGLLELKYPESDPNVVDIFYLSGYDRYLEYIENEWVARVDDELTSGSKKLKDYISNVFMDAMKIDGATYAVPNNRTIGSYTYMLVNKELLAKYYYDISSITTLNDCSEFLSDIARFEPDVVPIDGAPDLYNVLYWDIDPETLEISTDTFNIIGTTYSANASLGTQVQFTSLFASKKTYRDQLLSNMKYQELGYFRSDVAVDAKCAIKIVEGGAELEKQYGEDYHMVVLETPRANSDILYGSMMAVGGYSNDVTRAMEIITYINTNAELRNLIQYGIENVNYTLTEEGQVEYTGTNSYWMDINKTGNSFIAYTLAGTDPELWKYGMKQNSDATVDLILGFSLKDSKVDKAAIAKMRTLSVSVKARLDACTTYAELSALIDTLQVELRSQSNQDIKNYVAVTAEPNADGESTPYVLFYEWMTEKGFITEE